MCHMSACSILSYISIVFLKIVPLQMIKSRSQLVKIATLSVVFCASVVGGNISLRYLAVSFNQAVGATTPFFTALFAYLATFKREAWITYAALVPVVTGVVIASGVCIFCAFWISLLLILFFRDCFSSGVASFESLSLNLETLFLCLAVLVYYLEYDVFNFYIQNGLIFYV